MINSSNLKLASWFKSIKSNVPLYFQAESSECGVACLAMVLDYHGHNLGLTGLRSLIGTSNRGLTFGSIASYARKLGFICRGVRVSLNGLSQVKLPAIIHWDNAHVVVLSKVVRGKFYINDPALGKVKYKVEDFNAHFNGFVLELVYNGPSDFIRQPKKQRLAPGLKKYSNGIVRVIILTVCVELLSLLTPLYVKYVVDSSVKNISLELIEVLGAAYCANAILMGGLDFFRSRLLSVIGVNVTNKWILDLFNSLLSLPSSWFGKRSDGDVLSRFNSVRIIQQVLMVQVIPGGLDFFMSVALMIVMIKESFSLSLILLASCMAYGVLKLFIFNKVRMITDAQINVAASQQSYLMETIRAIDAVKVGNKQSRRFDTFSDLLTSSMKQEISIQTLSAISKSSGSIFFGLSRALMVWYAAVCIIRHQMSAGVMVALIAYAEQFGMRFISFIDKSGDFLMIKLHMGRIADIKLSESESIVGVDGAASPRDNSIEFLNVSFRHSPSDPWILKNLSFKIESGESVAITGPSGCGKTTVAKLIMGLIIPEDGMILFGGVDIRQLGLQSYRANVGAVMQDDRLLSGTLAENISFFDPEVSLNRLHYVASLVGMDYQINALPMKFFTRVGGADSGFSGGEVQRILLARALYHNPSIVVLDEATSHLDHKNEAGFIMRLGALSMTRISIAHRYETIRGADRVVEIDKLIRDGLNLD